MISFKLVVSIPSAWHQESKVIRLKWNSNSEALLYSALADEMHSEIHALSFRTLTPGEWRSGEREVRESSR